MNGEDAFAGRRTVSPTRTTPRVMRPACSAISSTSVTLLSGVVDTFGLTIHELRWPRPSLTEVYAQRHRGSQIRGLSRKTFLAQAAVLAACARRRLASATTFAGSGPSLAARTLACRCPRLRVPTIVVC